MKLSTTYPISHTRPTAWSYCAGMCLGIGGHSFAFDAHVPKARGLRVFIANEEYNQSLTKEVGR
jgi:hypothetical protein